MHVLEPDKQTEIRDQAEFDEAVVKNGKSVLEVLAGLGIFAALLMSIIALNQSSEHNTVTITGSATPRRPARRAAPPPMRRPSSSA